MSLTTNPIKVLHIGKFYRPYRGGMEAHLEALCQQMRGRVDAEVLVSNTTAKTESDVVDGVRVTRVGQLLTVASTPLCPGFISYIRRRSVDLVHLHWPNPAAALALITSGYNGPLVVTYHSDVIRQKLLGSLCAPILEALVRRVSAIIATSPDYIASSPTLRKHSSLCRVVPLGVADDCFTPPSLDSITRIRKEYGEKLVLTVGRLVYYKGFEYLIRAMSSVDGRLLIAGQGPLEASLVRLRNTLGLQDRVIFLANLSDEHLRAYYHAAAVFALASVARSEAFGIVQLEAMAAGTPVVNTNLPSGVPFVSRHGETGLTVPPKDVDALARAINGLLDNETLRRQYGTAGRARVETFFTAKGMSDKTLEIYQEVIGACRMEVHPDMPVRAGR